MSSDDTPTTPSTPDDAATAADVVVESEQPKKRTKAGPKSHAAEAKKEKVAPAKANPPRDPRGKKLQKAAAMVEEGKLYPLAEAVALAAKTSTASFDASIELHVRVNQEARGMVTFPKPTGKTITVATVTPEILEELSKGKITFDALLATPAQMPELAKYARTLGPKGLMPNPKSGTVTNDIEKAKAELESGRIEYRTDEGKNVHLVVGKVSSKAEDVVANCETALHAIAAFGIKHVALSATMGPGVAVSWLTE